MEDSLDSRSSLAAIDSTNIGFQLLKKHGWKEGTGLGFAKKGILVPEVKHNKLGLGAEKPKIQTNMKAEKSQATTCQNSEKVSNVMELSSGSSSSWAAINSSNIGFQLLKKHGWKEGTGLGIAEQGILVPVQAEPKHNKRGLGAEKITTKRKAVKSPSTASGHSEKDEEVPKKTKKLSKKMRKMIEHEKHLQEKEFERAFFREFWPDNV